MSKQFPHPFSAMAARFRKYRADLPRKASGIALKEFRNNFRRQGYRDDTGKVVKWQKRQDDKDSGRAILVKSGRLRRALRAVPTYREARVINATPYAAVHNRGLAIRGQMRARASNRRSRKERWRQSGNQGHMPARPFMVGTKPLMDDISKDIMNGLKTVFNVPSK